MKVRKLVFGLAAMLCVGATANASIIIPTNFGNGGDAEIREVDTNVSGFGGVFQGSNRGASTELATRAKEKQANGSFIGKNSSAQYMKFDISQLPVSSDSFWDDKQVIFRAYTRNANNFRAYSEEASAGIGLTEFNWRLRALDPNGTYSTSQTDQHGNAYTASQYQYDWTEGTGNGGTNVSGITAFNAPGRVPFCVTDACATANGNSLGFYDEFDSDPNVLDLGSVPMPGRNQIPSNNLAQRYPLTYLDPNGDLTQLVKDARDAGLGTITLIAHSGPDGTNFMTQPFGFLNGLNQLIAPKEQTTIIAAQPGDNAAGKYSPQLIVRVPEPASLALVCFGCLIGLVARRRR
jgi:hypothetical protein